MSDQTYDDGYRAAIADVLAAFEEAGERHPASGTWGRMGPAGFIKTKFKEWLRA